MKPLHVLLAAPEGFALGAYRETLTAEGFRVTLARTGLECLQAMRKAPPDVLVLDRTLPWGGSEGVMALMQEDPYMPRVPVTLVLTWPDGEPDDAIEPQFIQNSLRSSVIDGARHRP